MSLTINGRQINVQGIREINPGLTIQQASQKTKNNGLDEVYFNSNGKSYIAYGDSLNISMLHKNAIPQATFNGQTADIVTFEDEINSTIEGMKRGAVSALKDTGDAVIGAVKNIITTIGPTVAVGGGAAVAGYSIYQVMKSGTLTAAMSASAGAGAGVAAGAGTVGKGILDALSSGAVGALKIIAITGVVGAGVTATYGAIRGAMNASNITRDYSTITSVTTAGMAPTNGGKPLESMPESAPAPSNPGNDAPEGVPTNPISTTPYFPITAGVPQYQHLQNPDPNQHSFYQAPQQPQQVQQQAVGLNGLMTPQALFNK